jgi:bifunctional non-homologous end joining protein LigD
VIPKGEYGAGPVLLWDRGRWIPKDVDEALRKGRLEFELDGEARGRWILVKIRSAAGNARTGS